jgi:hypothetical protein
LALLVATKLADLTTANQQNIKENVEDIMPE